MSLVQMVSACLGCAVVVSACSDPEPRAPKPDTSGAPDISIMNDLGPDDDTGAPIEDIVDATAPDVPDVPDTAIVEDTPPDTPDDGPPPPDEGPVEDIPPAAGIGVAIDGVAIASGDDVPLPALTPAVGVEVRLKVAITSGAGTPVTVSSVELLATNEDETAKNVWVALDWGGFDPSTGLPFALDGSVLAVEVVYSPQSFDTNNATLRITSDDADQAQFTVRFLAPPVESDIRVEPLSATFEDASLIQPEKKTFEIFNDGIAPLVIHSVALTEPSDVFTLEGPADGTQIKPAGAIGAKPLPLTLTYHPLYGSNKDTATIQIESNDPDESVILVELDALFETDDSVSPCVFSWPDQEDGILDFSDAKTESLQTTVMMTNVGIGVCTLAGFGFPQDIDKAFYDVQVQVQNTTAGTPPEPLNQALPVGVGSGYSFLFDITYTPGDISGLDATFAVEYQDPLPKLMEIPSKGGGPEPCFEYAPGTAAGPIVLQLAGEVGQSVTRKAVVYNCGSAPLEISEIELKDDVTGAGPSALFALVGSTLGPHTVPANGIAEFAVGTTIEADPAELAGTLTFNYKLKTGSQSTTIPLQRRAAPDIVLPKADPGSPSDYPNVEAETPFTLDGSDSIPGSDFLSSVGYVWYLVGKPAGSKLVFHGPAGKPVQAVTPDIAGDFTFARVVKSLGGKPFYSPRSTVGVTAAPK